MEPRWTAVVADDETLMREALSLFLEASGEFEIIGEAADGAQAVEVALRLRPDVTLMDLRMPSTSGLEGIARLATAWPEGRIIAVTTIATDDAVVAALRAGAQGYVLKGSSRDDLVAGVRAVASGQATLSTDVVAGVIAEVRRGQAPGGAVRREADRIRDLLDERDAEVLHLLAGGLGNAEIARELGLSEATVKTRCGRLMARMGVVSRVQVVVRACELGLVEPRLR